MRINEIALTNQGEGIHAGVPSVFIRLQGCNLYPNCCKWCDTKYAQNIMVANQDKDLPTEMSVPEVMERISDIGGFPSPLWACITGGEPLYQERFLRDLVESLSSALYRIEIETNGTLPKPSWWTEVDSWVVDFKCPSAGLTVPTLFEEWVYSRARDQIKFVVGNEEDLTYVEDVIINYGLSEGGIHSTILVSPVLDQTAFDFDVCPEYLPIQIQKLINAQRWSQRVWEFCSSHHLRFSLQLHKIVFGSKRGV